MDTGEGGEAGRAPAAAVQSSTRMLGSLHEFRPDSENFSTYWERVQILFVANDVPEDKKVLVFLNAMGGATYDLLRSLLAPDSPMTQTLAQIVERLQKHFEPKPSIIVECFKFHKRSQQTGESIAMYIAELRRLVARCSIPCDHLDDTLRDRFMCGLRSENMQKQLLAEKELTLASALEKSQNLEAAHSNAQLLKGHTPTLTVGKVGDHKFSRGRNRTKTHEQSG